LVVCINKYDINEKMTSKIEKYCEDQKLKIVGKIPYDTVVTKAQFAEASVVEYSCAAVSLAIKKMWREINYIIA